MCGMFVTVLAERPFWPYATASGLIGRSETCNIIIRDMRNITSPTRCNSHQTGLALSGITISQLSMYVLLITVRTTSFFLFLVTQHPFLDLSLLIVEISTHAQHSSEGLLWTRDRPVADTSTWQHRHIQETDIHASSGIRTSSANNRKAAVLLLWPRGHRHTYWQDNIKNCTLCPQSVYICFV
jgi:hypothetical protein